METNRFPTTNSQLDYLVHRAQLGASVHTALQEAPEFEAIDAEDLFELLEAAVQRIKQLDPEFIYLPHD